MTLVATRASGWAAGFRNLLAKELGSWWRTRRWIVHLLLWLAVIAGFVLAVTIEHRHTPPARALGEVMEVFFQVGGFFALIGAVLVTQGAIVGERQSGTAAWVMTKPTTRKAFVLAKLLAITGSFLLLSLVIPAAAALAFCQLVLHTMPEAPHFLEAIGILALHQVFYISLTLMLGTLFAERGPVAGIALGFWIAGVVLPNVIPRGLLEFTPWLLAPAAEAIALWKPVPFPLWIPVTATAVMTVLCVVIALWRFEREEF